MLAPYGDCLVTCFTRNKKGGNRRLMMPQDVACRRGYAEGSRPHQTLSRTLVLTGIQPKLNSFQMDFGKLVV